MKSLTKQLKNVFFIELKRAICSKKFVFTILLGCIIYRYMSIGFVREEAATTFLFVTQFTDIEIYLCILAVLPYGVGFVNDWDTKHYRNIIMRSNKWTYMITKSFVNALIGGLVVLITSGIYVLYLCLTANQIVPTEEVVSVELGQLFLHEYINEQMIWKFFILYIFILFMYGALMASVGMFLSAVVPSVYTVYVGPFAMAYLSNRLSVMGILPESMDLRKIYSGTTLEIVEGAGFNQVVLILLLYILIVNILFIWKANRRLTSHA